MAKKITMDKSEWKKEHSRLDQVLRKGTKKEREEEARKQRREVNEKKRGK